MDPAAPAALKAGLRDAVDRLDRAGRLPKVSQLLPEVLHRANLPGIVTGAIRLVPDSVIDRTLPTAPLLRLDDRRAQRHRPARRIRGPAAGCQSSIESALLRAAEGEIVAQLRPF